MKTLAMILMVTALTACNTVAGLGTDIKSASDWTRDQMKPKTDLSQNK
jgi:predicted small secreted protein